MFRDIENSDQWIEIKAIDKGWSADEKFYVRDEKGQAFIVRISGIEQFEVKKSEFETLLQLSDLKINMSRPYHFGICDAGKSCYMILSWLEGVDAEEVLHRSSVKEQYRYGVISGEMLKEIHRISAPETQPHWELRFNEKMNKKIEAYNRCPYKVEGAEKMIQYIEANRKLLKNRPQTLHHGDYHVGNMIISPSGELGIIDFNRLDFGDPWEEFNRITWCAMVSPAFSTGLIDGYFDDNVPELFFRLMALYISSNQLSSIPWAMSFGKDEIDVMVAQTKLVLMWYEGMTNVIPNWYNPHLYRSIGGENDENKI